MAAIIYSLCALVAAFCATLLLRAHWRSRYPVLLWSGLCFVGLTLNNVLLIIDKFFVPVDLSALRLMVALASVLVLLYGLVWEAE